MITTESLDLKGDDTDRNPKLVEDSDVEEVKLLNDDDCQMVKIKKKLPVDFKQKLIKLLKKYHKCLPGLPLICLR